MSFLNDAKKILRTRFISGLLVVVPLVLTFVLLRALVEFIDGLLLPLVVKAFGHSYDFPFIGVIVAIILILLSGILTANVIGGRLVRFWEQMILKIPIVSFVYSSARQLVQALSIPHNKSFKSVVMVEYPLDMTIEEGIKFFVSGSIISRNIYTPIGIHSRLKY